MDIHYFEFNIFDRFFVNGFMFAGFSIIGCGVSYVNNLNILIMPGLIVTRIDDKLIGKEFQDTDYIIGEEVKKVTKMHVGILLYSFRALFQKEINSAFNRTREGLTEEFKEVSFNCEFICPLKTFAPLILLRIGFSF